MASIVQLTCLAAAGAATHLFYFAQSEHHFNATKYIFAVFLFAGAGILQFIRLDHIPFEEALAKTVQLEGAFIAGIYASLITYRAFFHPLNKFPGPFMARITNFWYTFQVAGKACAPEVMLKLHRKYGHFVRIGSSDLSITHPDAVKALYGAGSKCTKAAWYENDYPLTSMHTSRSKAMHDKRRRIWSPAFSDKALRGYEDRIKVYTDKLYEVIGETGGRPIDVSKWFNFYSFDVMGDLAFGESFDMLAEGKEHWAIKLLNEGMEPLHLMLPPWFFRALTAIPGLAAGYWKFIGYCSEKLDRRMKNDTGIPDIMSTLLEPYAEKPAKGLDLSFLQGDARLIIVAGSDTTAATLTHLFYHLAKDPIHIKKLREELVPVGAKEPALAHRDIQDAPYLNGCINEALRLNPPVPTAVQRLTPPEGIQIGDTFVPGNMTVWAPQYVLGHSEDIYTDCEKFLPERWYSKEDMVKSPMSFAPFSTGPFGCIGKPLALLELRTVVARLVCGYDINFAEGETGRQLIEETRDHFTLGLGPLRLTFKAAK